MNRQVDLKALISHIVRADGADKCRICMNETSDGHVFLGDTVMLEGNKPITLSDLLETVTGTQMLVEDALPAGLCTSCTASVMEASKFRTFCWESVEKWDNIIALISEMPNLKDVPENTEAMHLNLQGDSMIINFKIKEISHALEERRKSDTQKVVSDKYKCPDCAKSFTLPKLMYKHMVGSSDTKIACPFCAEIVTKTSLLKHMMRHKNRTFYPCTKCQIILLSKGLLQKHLRVKHGPGSHTCGECQQTFQSEFASYAHMRVHGLKTCPSCSKDFKSQTCYLYHVKLCCNIDEEKNSPKENVRTVGKKKVLIKNRLTEKLTKVGLRGSTDKECYCDYCKKKFTGKRYLAAHIQTMHLKNTHVTCSYCGKYLASVYMTEHLKKHEQSLSFTCEHCNVVLRTKLGYMQHLRLHTGEMPYKCEYCSESFSASSRRSAHVRKEHRKEEVVLRNECKYCPAKFSLPYQLRKHTVMVHSEAGGVPMLSHTCQVCYEKFGSVRGLVHHSRKHQDTTYRMKKRKEKSVNVEGN